MPEVPRTINIEEKPKASRFFVALVDLGFLCVATLGGILLFLGVQGWIGSPRPVAVLLLVVWCPFFWGKYEIARREKHALRWLVLACAALTSAVTVLAAILLLMSLIST